MVEYQGRTLTIRHCEQPPDAAPDSWMPQSLAEALAHIPAQQQNKVLAKFVARRRLLADQGQLRSPDYFNTEGNLPDGKRFYAIKADRLRAYGWFSRRHKGIFIISHFAFKAGQKLARSDTARLLANWHLIEEY